MSEDLLAQSRATAIHADLKRATSHIFEAWKELDHALRLAEADYVGNDALILSMRGAVDLLRYSIINEQTKWQGFAEARLRHLQNPRTHSAGE